MVVWRWAHPRERVSASEGRILNESLAPGDVVGERYRIIEPLARGGYGSVYVAEQLTTERRVALKLLVRYADRISVDRLLSEARVTSRLHSDHIVQVLDAGVDVATSAVFVVMELLSGATLEQRVAERGPCSPEETSEYVRQIAAGLEKAHGHVDREGRPTPVVHRDLKPSNLFLAQRDDGSALVKILDFGAAKVWAQGTHASGVIRGTPAYMASEQAAGEPSSPATDIWSLGLIAFFLLTGKSYWLTVDRGGSQMQLFAEILSLPLPSASERARALGCTAQLGPGFDAWFARSVTRDVARRFSSASLLARELSQVLGVAAAPALGSATLLETLDHAAVESTRGVTRGSRARVIVSTLGLVLAGGGGIATAALWKRVSGTSEVPVSAAPSMASPPPSVGASAEVAGPKSSENAPSEAASAPRPSSSLETPAPASSASAKPNKDGKKRRLPNPPATVQEGPKPPPRDVYEQR